MKKKKCWLSCILAAALIAGVLPDNPVLSECGVELYAMTNELDRVKISRRFRGVVYHIEISHAKVSSIFCDGQKLEGNLIPIFEAGSVHEVKVYIS